MSYDEYLDRLDEILEEYYSCEWYEALDMHIEMRIQELTEEYNNQ